MFSSCRERLVLSGVPLQCITRGRALDLTAMPQVQPSRVLMLYFDTRFRRQAARAFEKDACLRCVFWVEDDCKPSADFSLTAALAAVEEAEPAVAWLAWWQVRGVPRYGGNILGFTPASLRKAVSDLRRRRERAGVAVPRSAGMVLDDRHCIAMDTWIYQLSHAQPPAAIAHAPSLASQVRHELRGRR